VGTSTSAHSQHLLDAVRHAFVSGMTMTLWVSAALMAAGAVLAITIRPRAAAALELPEPEESAPKLAA